MLKRTDKADIVLKYGFFAAAVAFSAVLLYSFVKTPFTGDLQVFMAAANQVKYQKGSGLLAIFQSWELKGIGNRTLMYILYVIADSIAGFENKIAFTAMVHAEYAIMTIAVFAWSAYLIPAEKKQKLTFFLVCCFTVFTAFLSAQLQAEMSCVILSVLITALVLHGKKWSLVLSGVFGASLFLFKSIFFLLYIAALAGTMLYDVKFYEKKKNYIISGISMVVSEIVFVGLIKIIYPQEFTDMAAASEYQSTLFSDGSRVSLNSIFNLFTDYFTESAVAIPFLILCTVCTVLLIIKYAKSRAWQKIVTIVACWLIPMDIIIASNCYFQYHYFLLMLPGIICIITFLREFSLDRRLILLSLLLSFAATMGCRFLMDELEQTPLINCSSVLLVIVHLIIAAVCVYSIGKLKKFMPVITTLTLTVALFFWMNYSSVISPKYRNLLWNWQRSVEISELAYPDDFADEPVLFLDSGAAPFYVDAPSYSRYFFNLPMQRWSEGNDWELQKEEYEKLMSFNGKYILYCDGWFGLNKYPELEKKINSEYTVLKNSGMYLSAIDWNFFNLTVPPDTGKTLSDSSVHIMVRNE